MVLIDFYILNLINFAKKQRVTFENVIESDYPNIAKEMFVFADSLKIWALIGNLGAGKTTLIKYLAKEIGILENIQSPTFSLVNEYPNKAFHFDCYRLNSIHEALDFGMEEYLDSNLYCWIEWPEKINELILGEFLEITISVNNDNTRKIILTKKHNGLRNA